MNDLPLPALLSQAVIDITGEYARAGAGSGPLPPVDLWSNLIRCVGTSGVAEGHVRESTRLTKRAVRYRVGQALRHSWLETVSERPGSRSAVLGLTASGRQAHAEWTQLANTAEQTWARKAGAIDARCLRAAVETAVAELDLELPHFPATYGPADLSITGRNFGRLLPGQDWSPVIRQTGDTVSSLTLAALLSQALITYSIEYETRAGMALAYAANVLRFLNSEYRHASELSPATCRTLGAGSCALERHGYVSTQRDAKRQIISVRLTPRGQQARDSYRPLTASIDQQWEQQHGDKLRTVLREIVEDLNLNHPHHPIRA